MYPVIAALDAAHGAVQLVHRLGQAAAEPPRAHKAQHEAQRTHDGGDKVNGADRLRGEGARLLQDEREAEITGTDMVAVVLSAGERMAGEQLRAQHGKRFLRAQRLRGIGHAPGGIDEDRFVRAAKERREEGVEAGAFHAEHGVAEDLAAVRGDGAGAGQSGVLGAQRAAGLPRGRQNAPARAAGRGHNGGGGVEAAPLRVVDLKIRRAAEFLTAAVQKLVKRAGVVPAAAQRAARDGTLGKAPRRPRTECEQLVQLFAEGGGLGLCLLTERLLAALDHQLRHQQIAQQQRHERGEQDGNKNAVAEGPRDPCPHAVSSPLSARHAASRLCRSRPARARS